MKIKEFTFIDLFAGIGGLRIPFEEIGGKCIFSSEWDKHAQDMYEANFGERPLGDITKVHSENIPDHNILLGGFPCQPFSIIGDKKGFSDTRGTLFFEIERILRDKKPDAFLLENVKQLVSHDGGRTFKIIQEHLRNLGYQIYSKVLNTLDFGLPHKRERIFIVGFKKKIKFQFPYNIQTKFLTLDDILDDNEKVDKSLFASKEIQKSRLKKVKNLPRFRSVWHENKGGNVSALPYSCALRAGASYNYLLVDGKRRLSSTEMLRLQGFPESFKIVVTYTQLRKQLGNSVSIPVIRAIAERMLEAMKANIKVEINVEEEQLIIV